MKHKSQLGILLAASSLTIMAATAVVPALPLLRDHYGHGPWADLLVPLVITIPGLSVAICAPLAGCLADRYDRARLLAAGLALYVVAGASGLWLETLEGLVFWRVLLGCSVACIMTCCTALIVDMWEGSERKTALGLQASAMGVGGVVFPLAGGLLAEFGWRAPFAAYLLPLPLVLLAYAWLPAGPRAQPAAGPDRSRFPLAFALMIYALALCGMVVLYAIPLRMPFYARDLGHASPLVAALTVAFPSLVAALAATQASRLQERLAPPWMIALAFGCMALGMSGIVSSARLSGMFAGLAVCGIGFGLATPTLTAWLQSRMPADMRGRAAGGYTMAHFLGQFLATFVFAHLASATTFTGTFAFVAALSLTIAVIFAFAAANARLGSLRLSLPQRFAHRHHPGSGV